MFDTVIRNGDVVDGTGAPRVRADVAIRDGRIAAIGRFEGEARRVVDAGGKVVCPGFIDPHTHYDAQIAWDRLLSSSAEHGVTTVVLGNCGVGCAPCRPEHHDLLVQDLVNVEDMSKDVLTAGIDWQSETFPQYMDAAARRGSGINLAFIAPLAPLRTYAIGPQASEHPATTTETRAIAGLIAEAMDAGAFGFSTTAILSHIGFGGKPLSARLASDEELAAYGGVLRRAGRGMIELALTKRFGQLADDEYARLEHLLEASGRRITWLSLHNLAEDPDNVRKVLEKADPLIRRGALPQILTRPLISEMSLRRPFQFGEITAAKPVFDQSLEQQREIYADRRFRDAFQAELKLGRKFTNQAQNVGVFKVERPALKTYEGRTVGEIASERGIDPLDCLFDFALEDDLATKFIVPRANTDRVRIAEVLRESDRTLIGLSDGGAHVDMFCEAGYTTYLLGHWVREKHALTLEHAIKRITSEPADFMGIADRGRLSPGLAADVATFDPAAIGSPERGTMLYDLPAGGGRLYSQARGVDHVIVNGEVLYEGGRHTGAFPGQVLRSNAG